MSPPTARRLALSPLLPSLPFSGPHNNRSLSHFYKMTSSSVPVLGLATPLKCGTPLRRRRGREPPLWDSIELPSLDSPPCTMATWPGAELGSGPRDFCIPLPRGYCVRGPRRSAGLSPSSDRCRKGPGWVAVRPAQSSTGDTGLLTPDLLCKRVTGSY